MTLKCVLYSPQPRLAASSMRVRISQSEWMRGTRGFLTIPTTKVPMKSNPASSQRLRVTSYCATPSSPETLAMGLKNNVVSGLEDDIVWHILWLVVFRSRNLLSFFAMASSSSSFSGLSESVYDFRSPCHIVRSFHQHSLVQVLVPRQSDKILLMVHHKPYTHLDDDAERGLGEDAVVIRPKAIVEQSPGLIRSLFVTP
ncbi:hypothetical protein KCU65_g130, partial [Aureobasidium melanogenum]